MNVSIVVQTNWDNRAFSSSLALNVRPLASVIKKNNIMEKTGGITYTVNAGIAVQTGWDNQEFSSSLALNGCCLFEFLLHFGMWVSIIISHF